MQRAYHGFCKKLNNKYHLLFVNGIILAVALIVSLQKLAGISIGGILTEYLLPDGYQFVKKIFVVCLAYASVIKLIALVVEYIPSGSSKSQEPEKISQCILVINEEIRRHYTDIQNNATLAAPAFLKAHYFQVNIAHIVDSLANHLKRAFTSLKVKDRDIFISVYSYEQSPAAFSYITHWHPNRDVVVSRSIDPSKRQYKSYECVKALNSSNVSVIKWDCNDYAKSKTSRGKIRHYIGFKIELEGSPIGFVNVEFHNHGFFPDSDYMTDFVEKEIIAFKYLIEYQFLKKHFFAVVKNAYLEEVSP